MQQYLDQTSSNEIKSWINGNLKRYLKEAKENKEIREPSVGEIEHIIDFLNSREKTRKEQGKGFRLRKLSVEDALRLSHEWTISLSKKGKDIPETDADIKTIKQYDNGLRFVELLGQSAFQREGFLMSHCVASYFGKDSQVYSLRDANNNPHCTIEVKKDGNDVSQIKGKGNGSIHPSYIKYVLDFMKLIGKDIKVSEMTYLGYDQISTPLFALIQKEFKDVKYLSFKGENFIYKYQTLERL